MSPFQPYCSPNVLQASKTRFNSDLVTLKTFQSRLKELSHRHKTKKNADKNTPENLPDIKKLKKQAQNYSFQNTANPL